MAFLGNAVIWGIGLSAFRRKLANTVGTVAIEVVGISLDAFLSYTGLDPVEISE